MRYSIIKPQIKPIFNFFIKISLSIFSLMILMMASFDLFLRYETHKYFKNTNSIYQKEILIQQEINQNEKIKKEIEEQEKIAEHIFFSNTNLKDSINNLFLIIPEQISLTQVLMEKNKLKLHGITPSKDVFNFLLETPLRSIFHDTATVFYLDKDGWYRFVSENTLNDLDGF